MRGIEVIDVGGRENREDAWSELLFVGEEWF